MISICFISLLIYPSQLSSQESDYVYKAGDVNGIGKWYMEREIAYVMGYQGINWLERSEREEEEGFEPFAIDYV